MAGNITDAQGKQGGSSSSSPAKYLSPRTVSLYGVLIALTAAVTMTVAIPFPPTRGFFNLGDSIVFFTAFTFGMRAGGICGGIGSAAADILLGYGYFAPITLVTKGTEGFVAGAVGRLRLGRGFAMGLGVVAGGVGIAGEVQPVPSPAFAVMGRGEQLVNQTGVRVRTVVSDERLNALGRGRQADQVKAGAADQGRPVGLSHGPEAVCAMPFRDQAVDRIISPAGRVRGRRHGFERLEGPVLLPLDRSR